MSAKTGKFWKGRFFRIGLFLAVLTLAVAAVTTGIAYENHALFRGNTNFTLKKIQVDSGGWWNGKTKKVARLLGLRIGETNIFDPELAALRKKLTAEPSIEQVRCRRILPNTIAFEIEERVPRAFLSSASSPFLADENCVIMDKASCLRLKGDLPVISGFKTKTMREGDSLPQIMPAIKLVMLCNRLFPDINPVKIDLTGGDITMVFKFKGQHKPYGVIMPAQNIEFLLGKLNKALNQHAKTGDNRRKINLRYDGQVIFAHLGKKK